MTGDLLYQRLAALDHPEGRPDWVDVRRRARGQRGRRRLAAAIAAAVAVLAVAPALADGFDLLPFFRGEPAPESVREVLQRTFDEDLQRLERDEGLIVEQARGVLAFESPVGTVRLWAAPTTAGGDCRLIRIGDRDKAWGCRRAGGGPVWFAWEPRLVADSRYAFADGRAGPAVSAIGVRFADGSTHWMPIVDGYFAAVI
ncbi:MAG: hypothetical protein ICV59_07575, partial [Thermoleophilia bacterium]|nr:hypothetical protein [Thermoleophilia bacterium]